jgi:hypothetical protein
LQHFLLPSLKNVARISLPYLLPLLAEGKLREQDRGGEGTGKDSPPPPQGRCCLAALFAVDIGALGSVVDINTLICQRSKLLYAFTTF